MKIYDITLTLDNNTPVYPGDPKTSVKKWNDIENGEPANLSEISFSSHAGTHADAPKHFFQNGDGIDKISLDYFYGNAKVFDMRGIEKIEAADLINKDIQNNDIILLKTDNSLKNGSNENPVYISCSAAQYLKNKRIKTLGFDYMTIESENDHDYTAHKTLLGNGIIIIESLLLKDIDEGDYFLSACPLKLKDCDGSPLRAILISVKD